MNWKSNFKILATLWILVTIIGPMIWVMPVQAPWADPAEWYKTVPGVLAADYYKLYPFKTDKSLKLGFSKFGELINGIDNVGLEYRSVDPFAPVAGIDIPTGIPKRNWINGWLINISYLTIDGLPRNVWACALHADLMEYEGPWLRVDYAGDLAATYGLKWEDPKDPGYQIGNYAGGLVFGGRKTNGTAVTEPLTVLYEGPRRFVALLNTTIYDHRVQVSDDTSLDVPLVRLLFTIIFNKDKKEVYILKDVKSIAPKLTVLGKMYVQFSNRGEVDLGTEAAGFPSYGHFYVAGNGEGQPTPYDIDWVDVVKTIDPALSGGRSKWGPEPKAAGTFDVAQIVNFAADNAFFAAFWPSLSNWEIFGGQYWCWSLMASDPNRVDMPTEPHPTPFYIGEWDFELTDVLGVDLHFRGVTAYGVTDHWDGEDSNHLYLVNRIDSEVQYHLNETFNPWDLYKAHPFLNEYRREVQFFSGTGTQKDFVLTYTPIKPTWDQYCVFSERVLVKPIDTWLLQKPLRATAHPATAYPYEITPLTKTVSFTVAPPAGTKNIKVLYSVDASAAGQGRYEWNIVGRDSAAVDSAGAAMLSEVFDWLSVDPEVMSGLDMKDTVWGPMVPFVMNQFRTTAGTVEVRPGTFQPSRANYRDAVFKSSSGKSALIDDWCTVRAVSSSSIITVGSPWANHLTEYFNEFTDAYLDVGVGEDGSVMGQFSGKIVPLSCWNKLNRTYKPNDPNGDGKFDDQTIGYAVIATYKDLNGTVGWVLWGWTGQDTFYASKWFWDTGVTTLQTTTYNGVTAIILSISYATCPPSVTIVERLGTITELTPHPDP